MDVLVTVDTLANTSEVMDSKINKIEISLFIFVLIKKRKGLKKKQFIIIYSLIEIIKKIFFFFAGSFISNYK